MTAGLSHPSPNFGERRDGAVPRLVVLHYTAMTDCGAACARLCDPEAEVSAHYLIGADGEVLSLVPEEMRAWHAGQGFWGGCRDVNSASIGIELDNDGSAPFAEPQMLALERLLGDLLGRWPIPPEGVIGHSDTSYGRKSDPGPLFDWKRLAQAGLSVWPEDETPGGPRDGFPAIEDMVAFGVALKTFGYLVEDLPSPALLEAFRHRFRPEPGPFDARDVALARELARRFPVDPALAGA